MFWWLYGWHQCRDHLGCFQEQVCTLLVPGACISKLKFYSIHQSEMQKGECNSFGGSVGTMCRSWPGKASLVGCGF